MTQNNVLLEVRKESKERKPTFIRQDNPKRRKLNDKWRKPKGIHSKIRHHFKGRRKMPSPGYKSPVEVKGLHSSGLGIVRVFTLEDLKQVDKERDGIVVSGAVGGRKKLEILRKAGEMGIKVLNINASEAIKRIEDFMSSKKKGDTKKEESKVKKELKEKTEKKEEPKQEMTDQEKKEAEKKERDKVLTKKM